MSPLVLSLVLLAGPAGGGQLSAGEGRPEVRAVRLSQPVVVDGVLDEAVWNQAPPVTRLVQREPVEGAPATLRTEVRIAFDDAALYVAARLHDDEPGSIVVRLGRRDELLNGDSFVLYLDPYQDRRSGFFFGVDAAGTLSDGTLYNDDWDDNSWDGVWEGRSHIDALGWTAELRVPYSQLRFLQADAHRWGVNLRRYAGRQKEDAYLSPRPRNGSGFVSHFHELVGIEGIRPPRRLSALPYATLRADSLRHEPGDPFVGGSALEAALGADVKLGLGSNLTLDATVNPDFGQVEVDPAVVNLSDVETFFQEKRPFFIEGSSTFGFGYGGASNFIGLNWPGPDFFYSRRVGRTPQASLPDAEYSDVPTGVSILGAAKVTGKLGRDWNLGMLHAVTARERGSFASGAALSRAELEPAAYYGVLRAQREFDGSRHGLGLIATAAARDFDDQRLRDQLAAQAYALGVDGWTSFGDDKDWVLTAWGGASQVRGTPTQITALQESARHYFQRPDAGHVAVDPWARSLSGFAGRASLNKEKGNVLFNAAAGLISPGFDVNDLGFLWRADLINAHVWGGYRWTQPGRLARSARLELAAFESRDFDGHPTWRGLFLSGELELLSYWKLGGFAAYNPETLNATRTRGGPLTLNPPGWEWDAAVRSDDRRNLWARLGVHGMDYARGSEWQRSATLQLEWRPSSSVRLSVEPRLEWSRTGAQYLETLEDATASATFGRRYVFARLAQRSLAAGVRLGWTLTPRLSLQVYAQPLVSSGDYSAFGQLAQPRSYDFVRYANGAPPAGVDDPSFNLKSLRGNAVLRWEFHTGSTAYFVWTQARSDEEPSGAFELRRSLARLLETPADNVFLVKVSYWWGS